MFHIQYYSILKWDKKKPHSAFTNNTQAIFLCLLSWSQVFLWGKANSNARAHQIALGISQGYLSFLGVNCCQRFEVKLTLHDLLLLHTSHQEVHRVARCRVGIMEKKKFTCLLRNVEPREKWRRVNVDFHVGPVNNQSGLQVSALNHRRKTGSMVDRGGVHEL